MAFNYTKVTAALDTIRQRAERNRQNLVNMQSIGISAESDLNQIPVDYATLVSEINAEAIAQPSDEAIQQVKRDKDKLAADFVALKAVATAANAALATHIDPIK